MQFIHVQPYCKIHAKKNAGFVRFRILTMMTVEITVFCYVT